MSRISDDELRQIMRAATPGPWATDNAFEGVEWGYSWSIHKGDDLLSEIAENVLLEEDACLIALAPQLAAEVLQLREAIADMMALFSADGLLRRGAEVQAALALSRAALSPAPVMDAVKQGDAQ